jgi:hypothetical protein
MPSVNLILLTKHDLHALKLRFEPEQNLYILINYFYFPTVFLKNRSFNSKAFRGMQVLSGIFIPDNTTDIFSPRIVFDNPTAWMI